MTAAPLTLVALAVAPVWVGWKTQTRDGRAVKIPFDPISGRRAELDNPATWAPRNDAEFWAIREQGAGVGIMFTEVEGASLAGIDLDTCRDPDTGEVDAFAQEVVDRFNSYAEVSPSGRGLKVFFLIASADKAGADAIFGGQSGKQFKRGGGDHPPAIEIYRGRRYFAVTDDSIGREDLRVVSLADLQWLIAEAGPKFAGEKGGQSKPNGKDESRSARAFRAGAALKAGGASYVEMREALLADSDSEIAEWARTKGCANGEREMRRVYDKAQGPAGIVDVRAPYDIARQFQSGLATPLNHHRGAFYEWDGAAWPEFVEPALRARLYAYLDRCQCVTAKGETRPVKPNALMVGSVLDALRAAAHLDSAIAPPAWLPDAGGPPAHEIVACTNGLLHLPKLRLLPHTPSFFTLNALDFAYEPQAPRPMRWLTFLHQLWPNDAEALDALQEIFGYLLTSDTSQQKAFFMIGPKRSGKGTIARVLRQMIGPHNCVAPTLAALGTNFGLRAADRQASCHHFRRSPQWAG